MRADAYFNRIWYEGDPPPWWTRVLSVVFRAVSALRRGLYRIGVLRRNHPGVPVIVIGNLVAGGAGKTPLAIALIFELKQRGLIVGVVSRGYGGKPGRDPVLVNSTTSVQQVGDEPLLITTRTGAPVCVHPQRARAAKTLLGATQVDVLLCDDGLQHYALARDLEIAVIDGARGLGNGRLLPAGPLREPAARLRAVNHVVVNGELSSTAATTLPAGIAGSAFVMRLEPVTLINLVSGERREPDALVRESCVAIAGIGNPQRFFETLGELGYVAECRAFPDHHAYTAAEIAFANARPVLMTEKDAVKCREFAADNWWYLETVAVLEPGFVTTLIAELEGIRRVGRTEKPK